MDVVVGPALVTLHLDDRVVVSEPDGSMSRDSGHGFFAADTRFVSGYRLRLGGVAPVLLSSSAVSPYGARVEFTNPLLSTALGPLQADAVHLRLERSLGAGLHEDYDVVNYGAVAVDLTMEISLECDFGDLFEVKDRAVVRRGSLQSSWDERAEVLTTRYRNDDFVRAMRVIVKRSDSIPQHANGGISFRLALPPGGSWHTCLFWDPETDDPDDGPTTATCQRACHSLGSVWPHDNAILAAGMRRYGCDQQAAQVASGVFDAADSFKERRLPELFAGLPRDPDGFPVPYLGANVPQAWASGARSSTWRRRLPG